MANNDEWDDIDDDIQDDGSDVVKRLRQVERAQKKRIAELESANADLNKKTRQTAVKEILGTVGVTPKIARFVLADVDDPTPEAVTEWLRDNAEVFNIELSDSPQGTPDVPQGMSPDDVRNLASINQFVDTTAAAAAPSGPAAELEQQVAAATSPEELMRLLGRG